jgi:hypothetical protein
MNRGVAMTIILFCVFNIAAHSQQNGKGAQEEAGPKLKGLKPELKNLQHSMNIEGGVEITTAEKAADLTLAPEKFPQVRLVKAKQFFAEHQDRSKTPSGLYILDSTFIPGQLPEILKEAELTLKPDGILVNAKGEKVTMVLWHKLVAVSEKAGSLSEDDRGWSILPVVHAASPYRLSLVSAWGSWQADNGFCRSLTARTGADSWGPLQNGSRPHTRIQYIETRAWANEAGTTDRECRNCDKLTSRAEASFGCFWPAYGTGTYSYANLKDGSFSWTWRWWGD